MTYTQEQLEGMSDGEINKLVCEVKGLMLHAHQERWEKLREESVIAQDWLTGRFVEFDYCNSPSDMWPLFLETKISIIEPDIEDGKAEYGVGSIYQASSVMVAHANPLRAAAIVYILVKQGESS